jgi:hypothetical protein
VKFTADAEYDVEFPGSTAKKFVPVQPVAVMLYATAVAPDGTEFATVTAPELLSWASATETIRLAFGASDPFDV